MGIFLSPKSFSSVPSSDFLAESLVIRKLWDQNLPFRRFQPEKGSLKF